MTEPGWVSAPDSNAGIREMLRIMTLLADAMQSASRLGVDGVVPDPPPRVTLARTQTPSQRTAIRVDV